MKRLLMVAYFFPPMGDGGVFRSLKLSRYLPEHGWEPVVLCGSPEDYWVRDESLLAQLNPELEILRVKGLTGQSLLRRFARGGGGAGGASRRSSGLFRRLRALGDLALMPDSYAGWIGPARRAGRRRLARGDLSLIYSSGPPDSAHRVAAALAQESGLPWVADIRDPWFNLHLKNAPTPLHRRWHRRMEAQVLERAQVVAVTEGWRRYYAERCAREPVLIRNGYDPADFALLPPPATGPRGPRLHLLHTGKLSLTRSSRPLLAGIARFLEMRPEWRDSLRVHFLGPRESDNEAVVQQLGLSDMVRFEDSVSHAGSLGRQREADLLLLIKHDDPRYRDLVPGKFYEYIAAGRPILAITPVAEIESLMEQYKLGWTVRPDAAAVAAALGEILDSVRAGWRPAGEAPVELQRPDQARRMAGLFDTLTGGPGPVHTGPVHPMEEA